MPETKLELKNEDNQLNISKNLLDYSLERGDIFSNIKNVFSEIGREVKATGIEQEVNQEFVKLIKEMGNPKDHLSRFEGTKKSVKDKWLKVKERLPQNDNSSVPSLTKDERKSLKFMYELFIKLQASKKDFSSKFSELGEQIDTENSGISSENKPNVSTKQALSWLGWERDRVRLEKTGSNPYKDNFTNDWGDWSANPYANFYESEEAFNKDIARVNTIVARINRQIQSYQRSSEWINRNQGWLQSRIKSFQNLKNSHFSQKHIEMRVAEKLLQDMGQLN